MRAMKVLFDEVGNDWCLIARVTVATQPGETEDDGESVLPTEEDVLALVAELNAALKLRPNSQDYTGLNPVRTDGIE